eukprot:gene29486-5833_t
MTVVSETLRGDAEGSETWRSDLDSVEQSYLISIREAVDEAKLLRSFAEESAFQEAIKRLCNAANKAVLDDTATPDEKARISRLLQMLYYANNAIESMSATHRASNNSSTVDDEAAFRDGCMREGDHECDFLYIDFNAVVHDHVVQSIDEVTSTLTSDASDASQQAQIEARLIESSVAYLRTFIASVVRPRHGVYVAVDGLAPLSKMHQQRIRRYMSVSAPATKASWDRNAISPGTPFMRKLSNALKAFAETHSQRGLVTVSCPFEEDGEGEQMILRHIRDYSAQTRRPDSGGAEYRIMIHGLDADLILMSLTSPCWHEITLFRHTHVDSSGRSRGDKQHKAFSIVDVRSLRLQRSQVIDVPDFALLCMLMGNDFLPPVPGLCLREKGLEILVSAYERALQATTTIGAEEGVFLSRGGPSALSGIRVDALRELARELSEIEGSLVAREHSMYLERCMRAATRPVRKGRASPDTTRDSGDDYPVHHPDPEVVHFVSPGSAGWRTRYYFALFDTIQDSTDIREVCTSFLAGVAWTLSYLGLQEIGSVGWLFPHAYAPTMLDIYHLMWEPPERVASLVKRAFSERDASALMFREAAERASALTTSVREDQKRSVLQCHLLLILPPSSLRRLLECPLKEEGGGLTATAYDFISRAIERGSDTEFMFPTNFKLKTYLKEKLWECKPSLPGLDMRMLGDLLTARHSVTVF